MAAHLPSHLFFQFMTIAVSTLVRPSRWLRISAVSICLMALSVPLFVGTGLVKSNVSTFLNIIISFGCLIATTIGLWMALSRQQMYRIDISGIGQIRLTVLKASARSSLANESHRDTDYQINGEIVRLMENSTIWPGLLLLRLQLEGGAISTLPILYDCVSHDSFRALSVACKWISVRNEFADEKRIL